MVAVSLKNKCPDTPAGVQVDASGCPRDGDGDGVFDGIDACPDTRKGCVIDSVGCPKDSDGDGVCDGLDRCPDTSPGLTVDATGCPVEVLEHIEVILDAGRFQQRVNFETGKADLPAESLDSLDVVGQLLLAWPALQLEVGGYTDSRGSAAANQLLSEKRAQAVKDYLVVKYPGLKEGQLSAKGSGATKPVVPNTSARNMAKNRRVEFVVLNRDVLKKEVERRRLLKAGETPPPTPTPPPPPTPAPADSTRH